jgi:hypothetical protein
MSYLIFMAKLKVYVRSHEFPTVGIVDKEGAKHACAGAQATAFQGLGHLAGLFGNRYLSDEEREFLRHVEDFCTDNRLEYEIVDLGTLSVLTKMKLRLKGVKTPAISCEGKTLCGIPSLEDLKELVKN